MKALTIRQPFASLIVDGYKTVENRTWKTAYKGPLAIHAAASKPDPVVMALVKDHFWKWWFANHRSDATEGLIWWIQTFEDNNEPPRGAIVGQVELVDGTNRVGMDHPWALMDHYHWLLEKPESYNEPIEAKGKLGLWEWER